MSPALNWRKSSYSGGGEGNTCVEIAESPSHIAVRDSKNPTHGTLTLSRTAWADFLTSVTK